MGAGEIRTVEGAPDRAAAATNFLYVASTDTLAAAGFVEANGYVYSIAGHPNVAEGGVALNAVQRKVLRVGDRDGLELCRYRPPSDLPILGMLHCGVSGMKDKGPSVDVKAQDITAAVIRSFSGQVMTAGQQVVFEICGTNYRYTVGNMVADVKGVAKDVTRGYLQETTVIIFTSIANSTVKVTGQKGYASNSVFTAGMKKVNFEMLGIGGLDKQFEDIFRRAFASRTISPSILQRMGIKHVKGVLLYGPPGTGKTLIARQLGKVLNGKEPKVVNGPEILNKFVGASEENIRNLFAEADAEYKEKGDESELHVIIFDEIDAICKQRGSVQGGSGVHDTVVNQLLTKMDGVDSLNNILIIGMTNRKDMLDEALLRPGRLEVHIEVGLPDEKGRLQILTIHTNKMSENSFLSQDVDLASLSETTKNFSGAELEGLVTMADFQRALLDIKAAFGVSIDLLDSFAPHGIIQHGSSERLTQAIMNLTQQLGASDKTPVLSCLLEGPVGSGKSALAASAAKDSGFPFVKVITPETLAGMSEQAKSLHILAVFKDAYRSPLNIIILDNIEELIEYTAIGPRFSNSVLKTITTMVNCNPPPGIRMLIIGTSSSEDVLESLGLSVKFTTTLHVPPLRMEELVSVLRTLNVFQLQDVPAAVDALLAATERLAVPIKSLMLWVEMAKQQVEPGSRVPLATWSKVLLTNKF
ncbi:MAG: hypothetical protein WDW38_011247 [Sanguina aurantia]